MNILKKLFDGNKVPKSIYDSILWLVSEKTGKSFPIVQFSGDTDMVTMGWVSLTSVMNHEIVVTMMTGDELKNTSKDSSGYTQLESRVNNVLNRTDLVCSWIVAVVELTYDVDITTLSFQEFRKVYKKPQLFYRDIYSPDTFATIETETSRQDFERQGGKFLVL
ncbi:hypothetical protein [Collimonas arenae]|uniref:hypothetical protein n=1 Tax=Collimonas arenae TaxID=279058 RepID=UPI000778195A|nr:hypothetical protein [Collimonas arenae]